MERHASALKAARQSEKRNLKNRQARAGLRTEMKKLRASIESKGKITELKKTLPALLNEVQRSLMKASSKGLIKKGHATRQVSRLSSAVHKALKG